MTTTTTSDTYELSGCIDCLMLVANGDTSGTARCETEEGEAAYLADVARMTDGLHLCPTSWPYDESYVGDIEEGFTVPEGEGDAFRVEDDGSVYQIDWTEDDRYCGRDTESRFSMNGCEICGSHLGGDRHAFAGWKIEG